MDLTRETVILDRISQPGREVANETFYRSWGSQNAGAKNIWAPRAYLYLWVAGHFESRWPLNGHVVAQS